VPAFSPEFMIPLGLGLLFLLSFFGCGPVPIPLPITATILWLSNSYHMPVAIILTATVSSVLGWMYMERHYRYWLAKFPRMERSIPASYQKFFMRRTGLWLFVFNAVPFPWDPIRVLIMLNGPAQGDRKRLLTIFGLARLIRSTVLVTIGTALAAYKFVFWLVLIFFLLLPILLDKLLNRFLSRIKVDAPIL